MNTMDMAYACGVKSLSSYINELFKDIYRFDIIEENMKSQINIFVNVLCDKSFNIELLQCTCIPMGEKCPVVLVILSFNIELSDEILEKICKILNLKCHQKQVNIRNEYVYEFIYKINEGEENV